MPKHNIEFVVPGHELRKAQRAVGFTVNEDGRLLGTLWISKGRVEWLRNNGRRGKKLTWGQLADLIQEHGWH
jgi:hypothetical protein